MQECLERNGEEWSRFHNGWLERSAKSLVKMGLAESRLVEVGKQRSGKQRKWRPIMGLEFRLKRKENA
jgi:hypothetical protein